MNLSRCENGHFYDREKFATCPHCAKGVQQDNDLTSVFTESMGPGPTEALDGVMGDGYAGGAGYPDGGYGVGDYGGGYGGPADNFASGQGFMGGAPVDNFASGQGFAGGQNFTTGPTYPPTEPLEPTAPSMPVFDKAPVITPSVNNDNDDDDSDHTVGIWEDLLNPVTEPKAVSQAATAAPARLSTPCVGWLVAVSGAHAGQDFHLKVGKNFVGRDAGMDVALVGDKSVSRNKHAIVVYEPRQHLYLVQPGESSELVYLNDEVVLNPMRLSAYDIITIGEINLLFIPLCGERFNWETALKERADK